MPCHLPELPLESCHYGLLGVRPFHQSVPLRLEGSYRARVFLQGIMKVAPSLPAAAPFGPISMWVRLRGGLDVSRGCWGCSTAHVGRGMWRGGVHGARNRASLVNTQSRCGALGAPAPRSPLLHGRCGSGLHCLTGYLPSRPAGIVGYDLWRLGTAMERDGRGWWWVDRHTYGHGWVREGRPLCEGTACRGETGKSRKEEKHRCIH